MSDVFFRVWVIEGCQKRSELSDHFKGLLEEKFEKPNWKLVRKYMAVGKLIKPAVAAALVAIFFTLCWLLGLWLEWPVSPVVLIVGIVVSGVFALVSFVTIVVVHGDIQNALSCIEGKATVLWEEMSINLQEIARLPEHELKHLANLALVGRAVRVLEIEDEFPNPQLAAQSPEHAAAIAKFRTLHKKFQDLKLAGGDWKPLFQQAVALQEKKKRSA
jgi:hypothetical protein